MKKLLRFFLGVTGSITAFSAFADRAPAADHQEYFAIRIYQLKTRATGSPGGQFPANALLPALHRQNITGIGVFKPIGNDTAAIRRIYVFMPLKDLAQFASLPDQLAKDTQYLTDGRSYLTAGYDDPPYARIESILLKSLSRYAASRHPLVCTRI